MIIKFLIIIKNMRKRHQALIIKENAKNKIINELTLIGRTEKEQQTKLNNFHEEFIPENDVEIAPKINTLINDSNNMLFDDINKDELKDDEDSDCNENIEITDIRLPLYEEKKINILPDLQFQIMNGVDLGDFDFDQSNYIPEDKINITSSKNFTYSKYKNFQINKDNRINSSKINETMKDKLKKFDKTQGRLGTAKNKKEKNITADKNKQTKKENLIDFDSNINIENNRTLQCGSKLNFKDILNQIVFWTEESKNKKSSKQSGGGGDGKKKKKRGSVMLEAQINLDMILPKVNSFQLFNIIPKKALKVKEKIMEIQKKIKNKGNLTEYDQNIINGFLGFYYDAVNENNQNLNKIANDFEKIDNITYGDNWSVINFKK